jgi:membrane protease YdiL (CAAX protease family)
MQFRGVLLGSLEAPVGKDHAPWLSTAYFGLAHYFGGGPPGIPGVLITGALGALFAKSILETCGIAAAWFIHFCQNAVIYSL